MKRILLSFSLFLAFGAVKAQYIFVENFDTVPASGWTRTNQSGPTAGPSQWGQGVIAQFGPGAFSGEPTAFAMVNSASVIGSGTISNWLMTPVINLKDGDIVRFFSRVGLPIGSSTVTFADRMELRISTNGAATINPSGMLGVGDFTSLALTINPDLTLTGYPTDWTLYEYTVSGLGASTDCKIAFRYFVTNGGTQGANSNVIGLDLFSIERTLGTEDFFAANFALYPNPASDVINIESKNKTAFEEIQLTDLNGRLVKRQNTGAVSEMQINTSDLNSGIYFLKIKSATGTGTTKIIKN